MIFAMCAGDYGVLGTGMDLSSCSVEEDGEQEEEQEDKSKRVNYRVRDELE